MTNLIFIPFQVVLYHMCETYNERGLEHIGLIDLGLGGWNFLLVALGGTIIGKITSRKQ